VIENGIRNLESVSGRFQRIDLGQPFLVIVDYAHTDDALENLIRTGAGAESQEPDHHAVSGCGGEKDRTKRPVMGEVTGRLERPDDSFQRQSAQRRPAENYQRHYCGTAENRWQYLIEPDREKAIGMAMEEARSGDIVLLAGKGHENYQILADRTIEFDDREMARRALRDVVLKGRETKKGMMAH